MPRMPAALFELLADREMLTDGNVVRHDGQIFLRMPSLNDDDNNNTNNTEGEDEASPLYLLVGEQVWADYQYCKRGLLRAG